MAESTPYTVSQSLQSHQGRLRVSATALIIACVLPLIGYLYTGGFWLVTSMMQGEWATPGRPDPNSVAHGILLSIHVLLTMLSFAVGPVVLAVGWRKRKPGFVVLYLVCLIIATVLFRLDICQITSWIAD